MFITLAEDDVTDLFSWNFPTDTSSPTYKIRWWKAVEMPYELAWLNAFIWDHVDQLNGVRMLFDPDDFESLVKSSRATIHNVVIAAPPSMSGHAEWKFEKITMAWKARAKSPPNPIWIFRGQSGHEYISTMGLIFKGPIKQRVLIYSAE